MTDRADAVDDPLLEFYQGRDAVLTVIAQSDDDDGTDDHGEDEDDDDVTLLLVDASAGSADGVTVTEYRDLDLLLETNAERIQEIVSAAPVTPDGTSAEQAWERAVLAISPADEPVIVVRSGTAAFTVLDPVEALDDGRPSHLGSYDSIGDAIWRGLEFLAGDDEHPDDQVG